MKKTAHISLCEKYRYDLSRIWDQEHNGLLYAYIGVNPSTANASIDDATVRKWIGFTQRNDGRGFIVGNVFAYRSTDVKQLANENDPVGVQNNWYLNQIMEQADIIVPCWGSINKVPKELQYRFDEVHRLIDTHKCKGKPVLCFGTTKNGSPKHPLMLGYNTPLIEYDIEDKP